MDVGNAAFDADKLTLFYGYWIKCGMTVLPRSTLWILP